MKRIINIIALCAAIFALLPINVSAQTQNNALYVYRNDGSFNAFLREDIDSIVLSHYDTDEVYQDEYVTQEFYTPDSIYRIPIAAIDSVGLVQPETIINDDVFQLTSVHAPYILNGDTLSFVFKLSTPQELLPKVKNIVVSTADCNAFEYGIIGRVTEVSQENDGIHYKCEKAYIDDIFDQIVYTGALYQSEKTDSLSSGTRSVTIEGSISDILWDENFDETIEEGGTTTNVKVQDVASYKITLRKTFGQPFYASIRLKNSFTSKIDFNAKSSYSNEKKKQIGNTLRVGRIVVPYTGQMVFFTPTFDFYGYFQDEGEINLDFSAHLNRSDEIIMEYTDGKWSNTHTPVNDAGVDVASLSMSGYAKVGVIADILLGLNGSRTGIGMSTNVGLKETIDCKFDAKEYTGSGLYSAIKDSYARTTIPWSVSAFAQLGLIDKDCPRASFPVLNKEPKWGSDKYILPKFSEPVYTKGDDVTTSILTTTPSRDLLLPVKLGVCVETEDDELVDTQWEETSYRIKDNWISDELSKTFDDLKAGNYKAYPYVEIMGIEMKATPSSSFSVEGVVTTGEASDITDKAAALSGSEEGYDLSDTSARTGFCYSSQVQTPTLSDATTATANTSEDFTASITGLESGTTYYYCAYFKNSKGVKYGEVKTFTTKKVVTSNADGITDKSATLKGYIEGCDFSTESVEVGFCYSDTYTEPDKSNSLISGTLSGEAFSAELSSLEANTTYYYRAYGLMGDTYMYGDVMTFKTKELEKMVVTLDASDLKGISATLNGKIQGYDLTDATLSVGFCYSPSAIAEPDVNNSTTVSATKAEKFFYSLSSLTTGNTYSYRAYVKVSDSYVYGETKYFTPNSGGKLSSITSDGYITMSLVYDDQGRISELEVNKEEEEQYGHVYFTYDSDGALTSVKQWDIDEWLYWKNIKLTPEGYIKSLHWSAGGESGSTTLSYDDDGHLVKASDGLSGINLSWENGCLTSLNSYDNDTSDDDEPYSETIYYGYGDDENPQLQWSMATGEMWTEMAFTGFFGKGPSKLPNAFISDDTKMYLSYTKNGDGTIATETYSTYGASITYYYSYDESRAATTQTRAQSATLSDNMKIFTSILPRLFGRKR